MQESKSSVFWIFFFFLQNRSLLAKISIKRVRNLSQNAGDGYFGNSNFWGGMPPDP